jgi:predicted nuclease of predicted toxin-antitoxin system
MRFLCDVHISYKVVNFLSGLGYEAIHVNKILDKWLTRDKDICEFADSNDLIVITKDYDFRDSFFIQGSPKKLIKINLGNISTEDLINALSKILYAMERLDKKPSFMIEIDKNNVTFIDDKISKS